MIRISLSQAAFEGCATLPLGSVGSENEVNERGERLIWLAPTADGGTPDLRGSDLAKEPSACLR
jgi:hypothetical protein